MNGNHTDGEWIISIVPLIGMMGAPTPAGPSLRHCAAAIKNNVAMRPSILLLWPLAVMANEGPDFGREIRPILAENCYHCHGPDEKAREARLRLDTFEGATVGGQSGPAIVPGNPKESELVIRIFSSDVDDHMPPQSSKRLLTASQKSLLKEWIEAGAKYEEHWAWEKPRRPGVPPVRNSSLVRNPVDSFLLHKLEQEGLAYSSTIDPAPLLRRLSLDLVGLPPTLEDIRSFEEAWSDPGAREQVYTGAVDRLLSSPRFGERWGRPWLDLARYADSNGFQADQLRPSWSYRDWVIRALNTNMPFDQFTIEQIAGDLLPNATLDQKIATGFHRTVTCNVEAGVSPEGNRVDQVIDRVNTTATVWLGVTLECAQCHDHKYDPFTMGDYYSFFDFFNHTPLEVQLPSNKTDVSHDFVGPYLDIPLTSLEKETAESLEQQIAAADERANEILSHPTAGFSPWETEMRSDQSARDTLPGEIRKLVLIPVEKQNKDQKSKLQNYFRSKNAALQKLDREIAALQKRRKDIKPTRTLVMVEMEERRATHILNRGEFLSPGKQVRAGTPAILPPARQSGKNDERLDRLALAQWLVDRDNPLTARVAVNRWWAELFGNGIVATLEDFGTQSEAPSHPDLLDWLAVEFMQSGWDMKHLLRLMVSSQAYRQSSVVTPFLLEKDPRNILLGRAPRFRLNAERIRDNALAISGLLSKRMFGEPVMPYQPPGLWRQTGRNEPKWREEKDENRWRRGIYIVYRRAAPYPSMVNFDAPDRAACSVARARTNTPNQALTLLNDPAFVEMALALADRVLQESSSPGTRIRHAFRLAVSRLPDSREAGILDLLLRERLEHFEAHPREAEDLLGNPQFVYRPRTKNRRELAAWFYVASALLNLDETITRN